MKGRRGKRDTTDVRPTGQNYVPQQCGGYNSYSRNPLGALGICIFDVAPPLTARAYLSARGGEQNTEREGESEIVVESTPVSR